MKIFLAIISSVMMTSSLFAQDLPTTPNDQGLQMEAQRLSRQAQSLANTPIQPSNQPISILSGIADVQMARRAAGEDVEASFLSRIELVVDWSSGDVKGEIFDISSQGSLTNLNGQSVELSGWVFEKEDGGMGIWVERKMDRVGKISDSIRMSFKFEGRLTGHPQKIVFGPLTGEARIGSTRLVMQGAAALEELQIGQ